MFKPNSGFKTILWPSLVFTLFVSACTFMAINGLAGLGWAGFSPMSPYEFAPFYVWFAFLMTAQTLVRYWSYHR